MKIKILSAVVLTFILSVANFAQAAFDKAKLDQFFDQLAAKDKAMGSVAISKDGAVLYSRAVGYSRIEGKDRKPATVETKYRIGSITKMFTAVMILRLAEDNKLKLTDTVDKFFADVPNAKRITISNLLNHRSGLHSFTDDADYLGWFGKPKTQAEMLAVIKKAKPDFEPNARAAYSNTNFVLLGYILEKASGKSYQAALKEFIADRAKLTDTRLGGKTNIEANESYSYNFAGGWQFSSETDLSIPGGAGAIVSTPTDLNRFIEALFAGKLISNAGLAEMKTMNEGYGLGMFEFPLYGKKSYGHNGGIDGFGSTLLYLPNEKISIAYTSNGAVYPLNNIVLTAAAAALNLPFDVPAFETISVKDADLDKYLGVYSSPDIPLKLTITKDKGVLTAQATGQAAFPLEPTAAGKFKFDAAGISIEFATEKNQMTLLQGGAKYNFTREK